MPKNRLSWFGGDQTLIFIPFLIHISSNYLTLLNSASFYVIFLLEYVFRTKTMFWRCSLFLPFVERAKGMLGGIWNDSTRNEAPADPSCPGTAFQAQHSHQFTCTEKVGSNQLGTLAAGLWSSSCPSWRRGSPFENLTPVCGSWILKSWVQERLW